MSNKIITIPDDEDYEDISFLTELEAAEAQAISLSATKRRRTTPVSPPEGSYTAALKGSRSATWQNHAEISRGTTAVTTTTTVGGGACFKCGLEGHWARDCGVLSSVEGTGNEAVVKACTCGLGSCLVLTANTERNRGRKFFRCPVRQENGGCGFFEWCDESSGDNASGQERARKSGLQQDAYQHPSNRGTTGVTRSWDDYNKGTNTPTSGYGAVSKYETNDNKGYGVKTGSSCFKCGEEGHWSRDCPTTSSSNTMTGTGVRDKSSSDGCYKCGQSGHWARDCPTTSSSNTMTPTGVRDKSSSDGCYKCGQSGHWAKDCSQSQTTNARYY